MGLTVAQFDRPSSLVTLLHIYSLQGPMNPSDHLEDPMKNIINKNFPNITIRLTSTLT